MRWRTKQVAVIAAGLALVGGGGAALATAAGDGGSTPAATSPASEANAFLQSVASHLGVSVDTLKAAVKAAAVDRVDAALAAGRITKTQADALKQRIQSGNGLFGLGGPGLGLGGPHLGPAPGPGGELAAAAKAIGVDTSALLDALRSGKSIADVAKAHGVSVGAVEQAMLDAVEARLDAAVKAGKLTSTQESTILDRLKSGIDAFVNGSFERPGFGSRLPGGFDGFRGPAFGFRHAPGPTA